MRSAYESEGPFDVVAVVGQVEQVAEKADVLRTGLVHSVQDSITSSAVRSGYGFGPLTGSTSTLAPIRFAAFAAAASCSTPSSSCSVG